MFPRRFVRAAGVFVLAALLTFAAGVAWRRFFHPL